MFTSGRYSLLLLLTFPAFTVTQTETALIDNLIERWAPLVWMAPGERFLPLSVEEFLQHVYPADVNGKSVSDDLPLGQSSESVYLSTKKNLDSLKNESSFLFGRNPRNDAVPVYVTVTDCTTHRTFYSPDTNSIFDKMNAHYRIAEPLHFHLTYWMFYPYNVGKEVCFIGRFPAPYIFNTCLGKTKTIGNHVGDFEHVSLSFKGNTEPDEMFLSVHDTGVYYNYDRKSRLFRYSRQVTRKGIVQTPKFPPVVRLWKDRPLLFAAFGSHGLWAAPGEHQYVRVPKLYDANGYGIPWRTWKRLVIHHVGYSKPLIWMKYFGRWGNPESKCFLFKKLGICELSDGPMSILRRQQDFYC